MDDLIVAAIRRRLQTKVTDLGGATYTGRNWKWPNGLLPICHWGCAILSCADCADLFDPNVHHGDDWADSFFEESDGFEMWIRVWASGVDLWELMYGEKGHIAEILSARYTIR
jgi:hypothetical protein